MLLRGLIEPNPIRIQRMVMVEKNAYPLTDIALILKTNAINLFKRTARPISEENVLLTSIRIVLGHKPMTNT